MIEKEYTPIGLTELIDMISAMASLDFSKRLAIQITDDPIDVIAYGLNMLSEELESNVIQKSLLEEINTNLEQFSYTVAHDIRSPFNSALGLISLIEGELNTSDNENLKEYFGLLKKINERIYGMVGSILEYSRTNYNHSEIVKVDIEQICSEIINEYRVKTKITTSYRLDTPVIYYNETAIRQVFQNLIDNAIKYADKDTCELSISCIEKEDNFEISISDNGAGIKKEDLDKVFDLFENLRSDRTDSYGVGLSIVKKIITQEKGKIWVESTPGHGTTFTFTAQKR